MRFAGIWRDAMPNILKIFAVAILITGSTSSTSGASTCNDPLPETGSALVLPAIEAGTKLAYTEEIRHPALPVPRFASGTMGIRDNGRLVRHQMTPREEIIEVGETVFTVRDSLDGEANMLPIPADLKPLFGVLRQIAGSRDGHMQLENAAIPGPEGWRSAMAGPVPDIEFALIGCGLKLLGVAVQSANGIERLTRFDTAGQVQN